MASRFPKDAKEQYEFLVDQGEGFTRRRKVSERSIKTWRNRALSWLKANTSTPDLSDTLLVAPADNIQRCLAVLIRARSVVPFLKASGSGKPPKHTNTRKVFIVHGHDTNLKNSVARFLERLDLEPVILHEQPNRGRTIIEKFMDYSDVGFAVVLLTPDDQGGKMSQGSDSLRPRARQNVVLELGFFLGRLGRANVAALYDSRVEMPSDYSGVLFVPYDDGGVWQLALAKEIKAAGISLDMNRL